MVADEGDLDEIAHVVAAALGGSGTLDAVSTAREALAAASASDLVAVVVGIRHPDGEPSLDLVDELALCSPGTPVVVVAPSELAPEVVARGATRVGWKGAARGKLLDALERASASERRREAARDAALSWRAVARASGAGVVVVSPSGRVLEADDAAAELLGRPVEELRFSPLAPLLTGWRDRDGAVARPEDVPPSAVLRTGLPVRSSLWRVPLPGGGEQEVLCAAVPLVGDGGPGGAAVSLRLAQSGPSEDVAAARSERDEATEAARAATAELAAARAERDEVAAALEAERRRFLLVEHAADGYLVLDETGRVTEASESVERYLPLAEVVGSDARRLVAPAARRALRRLFADVVTRRAEVARAEVQLADRSGSERVVEVVLSNRLDEPAVGGVVANVRDVAAPREPDASRAFLSAIVESSADSIVGIGLDGRISSWNRASELLYGTPAAEAVGSPAERVVDADERGRLAELLDRARAGEVATAPVVRAAREDGTRFELSLCVSPVHDASGALVGVSSIGRDITDRRQLERDRHVAEERCRLGFERGAIGMLMFDPDGTVTRVNAALCTMLGRREKEVVGTDVERFAHPDDLEQGRELLDELLAGTRSHYRAERRFLRADGKIIWALVDVTAVREEDGRVAYLFGQLQDVTARKRAERALEQQALHDPLTGLPNRLALEHRLSRSLDQARADGTNVAVLFVDADNFKLVNEGLGHVVGDRVLVELAGRLATGVRIGDTTARFGGDEFLVVCEGVTDEQEARQLAERVVALVDRPIRVDGRDIPLTVSCGVAVVDGSASPEVALRGADEAMYRAKENGRARVEVRGAVARRDPDVTPVVERTVVEVSAVPPAPAGLGEPAEEHLCAPGA